MKTVRTMLVTVGQYFRHKSVERDESTHVVPRSGLKRLGYTAEQREQLRAIKMEMSQCNN